MPSAGPTPGDKPPVLPALASPICLALFARGVGPSGPGTQPVAANPVLTWAVAGPGSAWSPASPRFAVIAWAQIRRAWFAALFAVLWSVGAVYACAGMVNPRSRVETRREREPSLRVLQRFVIDPWGHVR